jgi:hypothetical protein
MSMGLPKEFKNEIVMRKIDVPTVVEVAKAATTAIAT